MRDLNGVSMHESGLMPLSISYHFPLSVLMPALVNHFSSRRSLSNTMSTLSLRSEPFVIPPTSHSFEQTKQNAHINAAQGFRIDIDYPDDTSTKKRSKDRPWKMGIGRGSRAQSSIRSLGQKLHAKLACVISGMYSHQTEVLSSALLCHSRSI